MAKKIAVILIKVAAGVLVVKILLTVPYLIGGPIGGWL